LLDSRCAVEMLKNIKGSRHQRRRIIAVVSQASKIVPLSRWGSPRKPVTESDPTRFSAEGLKLQSNDTWIWICLVTSCHGETKHHIIRCYDEPGPRFMFESLTCCMMRSAGRPTIYYGAQVG
jgi:hypothetical protein